MQRYDPDCWLQTMAAEGGTGDDGEEAPPAIEEITLDNEDVPPNENINVVTERKEQPTFSPCDYKNGDVFETHCWSQTQKDVELQVKLPEDMKSSKKLSILIKPQSIKVNSKLQPELVILEGNLSQRIKHNEAVWSIDKNKLIISFGWEIALTSKKNP